MRMADTPLDYHFDGRVAGHYDAVRAHPPQASGQIAQVLAEEIGVGGNVFEPGVGTGRIALPMTMAGLNVVGADNSQHMLDALAAREHPGPGRLELMCCDATNPALAPGSMDAVVCVHFLHLLSDWQSALTNYVGLLRPGGCLILGRDWIDPASFAGQLRNQFRRTAVEVSDAISSPPTARAFVEVLMNSGAAPDSEGGEKTAAEWQTEVTPRQLLDQMRSKDDPESWVLPDDLLARVMEHLDAWAATTWADVDAPQAVTRRFVYSLFRTPR